LGAKWLSDHGVAAFVMKIPVSASEIFDLTPFEGNELATFSAPSDWYEAAHLNGGSIPESIGLMGFSAVANCGDSPAPSKTLAITSRRRSIER